MDGAIFNSKSISCLIVSSFLILNSCQEKKVNEEKLIDDDSSRFSSKLCYGQAIPNSYIIHWKNGDITKVKTLSKETLIEKYLHNQSWNEQIDFIEQDRRFKFGDSDSITTSQYALQAQATPVNHWGQMNVEAAELWKKNILGEGVVVAVIDSGIDIKHPQLKNQIYINENEIPNNDFDDDGNGFIDDYHGYDFKYKSGHVKAVGVHGTHVAGIIAADPNFGPMMGVAPKAKILPINFMSEEGDGSLSDAIFAMEYAIKRKANIINASWGGAPCSDSLKKEIDKLSENGILFVVAAGNSGVNLNQRPEYPAAYQSPVQITVGAIAPSGRMTGFSNYSTKLVDIMAPGFEIWSTVPLVEELLEAPLVYPMNGTSMAAPFVSGTAALLMSKFKNTNALKIKEAILKSAEAGEYLVTSKGRLNSKKASEYLEQNNSSIER